MSNKLKNIAIIIPAYNEEKTIVMVVTDLQKTFKNQPYNYKIIV